jgi:hypothetical protein
MSQIELTPVGPARPAGHRWHHLLMIGVLVLAVLLMGLSWFILIRHYESALAAARAAKPESHVARKTPAKSGGSADRDRPAPAPLAKEEDKRPSSPETPRDRTDPPQSEKVASETKTTDAAPDREAMEALRSALGATTGVGIREAHLSIGLLADGVEAKTYKPADAVKVLDTVTAGLVTVDRKLEQLPEKSLAADDREDVARVRKAISLLLAQGKALSAYWNDRSKETAERYEKARMASWAAIRELLQID